MYAQAGSQFRDELQRHNLPSSLVDIKQKNILLISLLFNILLIHTNISLVVWTVGGPFTFS